jgi:hypothetical protein
MNKDIMLGILIGFILTVILFGVGSFFLYPKLGQLFGGSQPTGSDYSNRQNNPGGNCAPATGETAFSGKVSTISPPDHPEYKQYVLQSADGQITAYLIATPAQESILQGKTGKDVQVNGTPAAPNGSWTGGVKVTTICP